jgi:hypothetical protein
MPWHRLLLLLALTGCGGGAACPLVGCVSELVVRLPAGATAGTACVAEVCATRVVDGVLRVPLGRGAEGDTAQVTVTLPGTATPLEGEVPVVRTRPNGRTARRSASPARRRSTSPAHRSSGCPPTAVTRPVLVPSVICS